MDLTTPWRQRLGNLSVPEAVPAADLAKGAKVVVGGGVAAAGRGAKDVREVSQGESPARPRVFKPAVGVGVRPAGLLVHVDGSRSRPRVGIVQALAALDVLESELVVAQDNGASLLGPRRAVSAVNHSADRSPCPHCGSAGRSRSPIA